MVFFLHYTILTNILCLFLPLISILKYYKIIGKKATSLESLQYILYHWQVYNFIEDRSHYRTCIHVRKFQTFFFLYKILKLHLII